MGLFLNDSKIRLMKENTLREERTAVKESAGCPHPISEFLENAFLVIRIKSLAAAGR